MELMELQCVRAEDKEFVRSIERHISDAQYANRVYAKSGYVLWEKGKPVGIMDYSILWNKIPFLNLLYVIEALRGRGIGREAMSQWEAHMKKQGYPMVLTSTQVDEEAQHFYRKLGYTECGALLLNGTPFEQPMEMLLRKVL